MGVTSVGCKCEEKKTKKGTNKTGRSRLRVHNFRAVRRGCDCYIRSTVSGAPVAVPCLSSFRFSKNDSRHTALNSRSPNPPRLADCMKSFNVVWTSECLKFPEWPLRITLRRLFYSGSCNSWLSSKRTKKCREYQRMKSLAAFRFRLNKGRRRWKTECPLLCGRWRTFPFRKKNC